MFSHFFSNKKEKKSEPISISKDVTEICQNSYNSVPSNLIGLGGKGTSSGTAETPAQALKDWKRAANPKINGGQEVLFFSDKYESGQITLTQILKQIYDKADEEKDRDIVSFADHYTFKNEESLKKFFKDNLFCEVKDEKEKEILANDALLNLHQAGLPNTLNTLVFENLGQTLFTKTLNKPTAWKETYKPLSDGVLIMVEHDCSSLTMTDSSELLELKQRQPEEGRVLLSLRCDSRIYLEKDEKNPDAVKINHEIVRAHLIIKDDSIKDFIFGLGFVVDYPAKLQWFDDLYEEINKFDEKDINFKNTLQDITENFRYVDLNNVEDLKYFHTIIIAKMHKLCGWMTEKLIKDDEREKVTREKQSQAYDVLMKFEKFIFDKIRPLKMMKAS